ncbi:hypothetical protein JCM11251_004914 [Rhodosporidiobolus azoricus]
MLLPLRSASYRSLFSRRFSTLPSSPSSSLSTQPLSARPSRLTPYLRDLHARYPHTSPSTLTASFLILHELTALVPLILLFGTFSFFSLGTSLVSWTVAETSGGPTDEAGGNFGWAKGKVRGWLEEAEEKAGRVGRRYGVFGWEKETAEQRKERKVSRNREKEEGVVVAKKERDLRVGGEVANLVAAYLVTKALLPLRILISLRLTPTLANGVVGRFRAWRLSRTVTSQRAK